MTPRQSWASWPAHPAEAQHTPGPWEVFPSNDDTKPVYIIARFAGEHLQYLNWKGKQVAHPSLFQTRTAAEKVLAKANGSAS